MNLLLCMSVCGTLFLLFAFLADILFLKKTGAGFILKLYRLTLLMYLVPFQYFKYQIQEFIHPLIPYAKTHADPKWLATSDMIPVSINGCEYYYLSTTGLVFLTFCFCVTFTFLLYHAPAYCRTMYRIHNDSMEVSDSGFSELLLETEFRSYRNKVRLLQNPYIDTSFTTGTFRRKIVLPELDCSKEERKFIYRHELCHIKNHDIPTKLLCLAAIGLHWFNPFIYLLYLKLDHHAEYACDQKATSDMDQNEKLAYCRLLVHLSTASDSQEQGANPFAQAFATTKKNVEKRLFLMIKFKPKQKFKKILIPAATFAMLFSSILTTNAYSPAPKHTVPGELAERLSSNNVSDIVLVPNGSEEHHFHADAIDPRLDFSVSDNYLINENHQAVPFFSSSASTYALCNHRFVNMTLVKHTPDKLKGSCTVKTYNVSECSWCGMVTYHSLISTTTYPKCPHK